MNTTRGYIGIVIAFLAAILLVVGVYAYNHGAFSPAARIVPIQNGCTMEAKRCWDGSYVGRTGPNCEFAACPPLPTTGGSTTDTTGGTTLDSGITGTITLGPTCPVERFPPDPSCADKPYQAPMVVEDKVTLKEVTHFTSAADGTFKVTLPPGTYMLVSSLNSRYPYTSPREAVVLPHAFTHIDVSFDTGIR